MIFVTSLSPTRVDRQKECIASWGKFADEIVAMQSYEELSKVSSLFPEVKCSATSFVNKCFSKYNPDICQLLRIGYGRNILVINSDIELTYDSKESFNRYWKPESKVLKCGIRCNYKRDQVRNFNPYGIDVFLIDKEAGSCFDQTCGFSIGIPGWDYWLPLYMNIEHDYTVEAMFHPEIRHEDHDGEWNTTDQKICSLMLMQKFNMSMKQLSLLIQKHTGRTGWTPQSSYVHTSRILAG